jgi:hypothetical protein
MTFINDKSEVRLLENGVFFVSYKDNVCCDKVDFEVVVDNYVEIGQGEYMKVLATFPEFTSITYEAHAFLQSRPIPAIAEAIVFQSLAQRILFSVYSKIRKQKNPVKGFNCEKKAMEWLENL